MILCKRAAVTSTPPSPAQPRSNGTKSEGSNIKVPYAYLLSSNFLPVSNLHKALVRRLFIKFRKYESDGKISHYENSASHNIYNQTVLILLRIRPCTRRRLLIKKGATYSFQRRLLSNHNELTLLGNI